MDSNKRKIADELKDIYIENKDAIADRIREFESFLNNSNDEMILQELFFCILSSGVGPKIAEKSLNAIKNDIWDGTADLLTESLRGVHIYPEKASYLTSTRDYLKEEINLMLKSRITSFKDSNERRDYFANNKNIKGLGYVQASHFLRNIGYKGYAILDKNILKSLLEFKVIDNIKPPSSRKKYLEAELKMSGFAKEIGITLDELDLVLWTRKRGYIPR